MTRLIFIFLLLSACSLCSRAQVGRDWGVEEATYVDATTGLQVRELTRADHPADNLYFHLSNFTADNRFVIFAGRFGETQQLFRAEVSTGRITQLTDGPGASPHSASPDPKDPRRIFMMRGPRAVALDPVNFDEREIGEIPEPRLGGHSQPTLSHDGADLVVTRKRDASNWEIGLINLKSKLYRTVITQGFPIGHVQHSPTDPVIFYVWETGGFAPQRTWLVNSDGSGNRPFYARTAQTNWFTPLKEWVTHEAWVADTGEMTMINDKLGVMVVAKTGASRMVREGNYWHAAARRDGRYLVLDDAQGRLWLAETATGNVRLLAAGLRNAVKVHAHASFDRHGNYIQFHTGRTHETIALIDLRQLPKDWYVPLPVLSP